MTLPRKGVTVKHGIVSFRGEVSSPQERQALRVVAERVPGVKGVEDHTRLRKPVAGKAGPEH